jgi:hypothetical protein
VPASGRAGFARASVCDPEPKPAELSDQIFGGGEDFTYQGNNSP